MASSAGATTITVTSTADVAANDGVCTLREAITAANTNVVSGAMAGECAAGAAGLDTIAFNIAGGCATPCAITLGSQLPDITEAVTIDGYLQPGASMNTLAVGNDAVIKVEIKGSGSLDTGFNVAAAGANTTIRGLAINGFAQSFTSAAVYVFADNVTVEGNFVGTDTSGSTAIPDSLGIRVFQGNNTRIGGTLPGQRNLISGNTNSGINYSSPGLGGVVIQGNYIGTNAAGTAALPGGIGIVTALGGPVTIGGTAMGAGNLISGATGPSGTADGIQITNNSGGATIQGNIVGLDASGANALGNLGNGILLTRDPGNPFGAVLIGGTIAGARNVISGNGFSISGAGGGIVSSGASATIQGNYIGTDATGSLARPNKGPGIAVSGSSGTFAENFLIGGAVAGAGNVVSSNNNGGIKVVLTTAVIQGNRIGTAVDGVSPLGNGLFGVNVDGAVATIGGAATAANVIAFTNGTGALVTLDSLVAPIRNASNASILGNSIHSNVLLGIDLGAPGSLTGDSVTANDACDADTGPNNLQNFPVLTSASVASGNVTISGTLNSTASTTFRVEFFSNSTCHGTGPAAFGEGQTFLGFANVTTDATCNGVFGPLVFAVPPGEVIFTSTATDPANNTSEFSACFAAGAPPPTPTPTVTPTPTSTPVGPTPTPTVTPTPAPGAGAATVPTLAPNLLALMGLALALVALFALRKIG